MVSNVTDPYARQPIHHLVAQFLYYYRYEEFLTTSTSIVSVPSWRRGHDMLYAVQNIIYHVSHQSDIFPIANS